MRSDEKNCKSLINQGITESKNAIYKILFIREKHTSSSLISLPCILQSKYNKVFLCIILFIFL